jgi:pyruvate kinase
MLDSLLTHNIRDTKGPEVRTAKLRDGKSIQLVEGQELMMHAVGEQYTTWEGYQDKQETHIGVSYRSFADVLSVGSKFAIADGTLGIQVVELVSDTVVKGKALNPHMLGQLKNCKLLGSRESVCVLSPKDVDDLQNFCAKYKMDFVSASFVQSAADVGMIRRILDAAGGHDVKIISKIATEAGLRNIDEIIAASDGIMIARGYLGMEIPSEKVALAQKMIITKCNVAGKFVITVRQLLESMIERPLPTRAEMTDVANAVFDGTDCVSLSRETAIGRHPEDAVRVIAAIAANAELVNNYYAMFSFIRDFTPKVCLSCNLRKSGGNDAQACAALCVCCWPRTCPPGYPKASFRCVHAKLCMVHFIESRLEVVARIDCIREQRSEASRSASNHQRTNCTYT